MDIASIHQPRDAKALYQEVEVKEAEYIEEPAAAEQA